MAKKQIGAKPQKWYSRTWRPGDYIRQLSVIIIGILITFQGSAWLESARQRRESRELLAMVEQEMGDNLAEMMRAQKMGAMEIEAMGFFRRHINDVRSAPRDSIKMYSWLLDLGLSYSYTSNAFEVLKSSPSAANKIDKQLMSSIFLCYDRIKTSFVSLNYYYSGKFERVSNFFFSIDRRIIEQIRTGEDMFPYIETFLANPSTGNIIYSAESNMTGRKEEIDDLILKYGVTLKEIEKYTHKVKKKSVKE